MFTAETVNSYSLSWSSRPAVNVQHVVNGNGSLVGSASFLLTLRWYTQYQRPGPGAVHRSVMVPLVLAVADRPVGAAGGSVCPVALATLDSGPVPAPLDGATVNSYRWPSCSPRAVAVVVPKTGSVHRVKRSSPAVTSRWETR